MSALNRAAELDAEIWALEQKCLQQQHEMKMIGAALTNDLKPVNLIKSAFKTTTQSPGFGAGLLKGVLGIAAGVVTKKLFLNKGSGIAKKAIGTAVELGLAKTIANNAGKIAAGGIRLFSKRGRKAGMG